MLKLLKKQIDVFNLQPLQRHISLMPNGTRMLQVSHSRRSGFLFWREEGEFMQYKVVVANGEKVFEVTFLQVREVYAQEGMYYIYDTSNILLFTAPTDSVVYIALA